MQCTTSTYFYRISFSSTKFLAKDVTLVPGFLAWQKAVNTSIADEAAVDTIGPRVLPVPAVEQVAIEAVACGCRTGESERSDDQGKGEQGSLELSGSELHVDLVAVRLVEELLLGLPRLAVNEESPLLDCSTNSLSGRLDPHEAGLAALVLGLDLQPRGAPTAGKRGGQLQVRDVHTDSLSRAAEDRHRAG